MNTGVVALQKEQIVQELFILMTYIFSHPKTFNVALIITLQG
jgi:hypothetical protein